MCSVLCWYILLHFTIKCKIISYFGICIHVYLDSCTCNDCFAIHVCIYDLWNSESELLTSLTLHISAHLLRWNSKACKSKHMCMQNGGWHSWYYFLSQEINTEFASSSAVQTESDTDKKSSDAQRHRNQPVCDFNFIVRIYQDCLA